MANLIRPAGLCAAWSEWISAKATGIWDLHLPRAHSVARKVPEYLRLSSGPGLCQPFPYSKRPHEQAVALASCCMIFKCHLQHEYQGMRHSCRLPSLSTQCASLAVANPFKWHVCFDSPQKAPGFITTHHILPHESAWRTRQCTCCRRWAQGLVYLVPICLAKLAHQAWTSWERLWHGTGSGHGMLAPKTSQMHILNKGKTLIGSSSHWDHLRHFQCLQ